jgi:endonuclease III
MPKGLLNLGKTIQLLREYHGPPAWPPTSDPFELILLENVAYLATPARRLEAFKRLRREVGTSPRALLAARRQVLKGITAAGILKAASAAKLRECARIAQEQFHGDMVAATEGSLAGAKRALRAFPGIGAPGADKILLFMGRHAQLSPDSNGLRVLVRLGLVREQRSYAHTYAGSRLAEKALPAKVSTMQEAHLLLQQHGRTICKRSVPRCGACVLAGGCAYARRGARAPETPHVNET